MTSADDARRDLDAQNRALLAGLGHDYVEPPEDDPEPNGERAFRDLIGGIVASSVNGGSGAPMLTPVAEYFDDTCPDCNGNKAAPIVAADLVYDLADPEPCQWCNATGVAP